jgi:hypothetical protein
MIRNLYEGDIELYWGDITTGTVLYKNLTSKKIVIGFLSELRADKASELEPAINAVRMDTKAGAAGMVEFIREWLKEQPHAVKLAFEKGFIFDGTSIAVLKNFIDWIDNLQAGNTKTTIQARSGAMVPIIKDILGQSPARAGGGNRGKIAGSTTAAARHRHRDWLTPGRINGE